ncbi:ion transporter [Raoultibacter phocaeensis]|uniref:ion transporter n=1 Tax=Raoultibacter phocaeensis TaxID=2479841 RepID=UPI0021023792|nr:ion transporter [Raoultibacter phocaeensis]
MTLRVDDGKLDDASPFKRQAFYALNAPMRGNVPARVFGIGIFVLIIANALFVFVDAHTGLPDVIYAVMAAIGMVSTVCFLIEYCFRVWTSDLSHADMKPKRARVRYVVSLMGLIDLLAFLPGMLAWFFPLSPALLASVPVIRLVRLIKISRYMKGLHSIALVFEKRRQEIISAFMVLALLTVTASVLMYQVENPVQPEKFDSVFTGMYWAMTTITSTGYGDLVPVTGMGRFIGFCTMVLSIAVVAIPAGIFSAGFVSQFREDDARTARRERRERMDECEGQDEGDGDASR